MERWRRRRRSGPGRCRNVRRFPGAGSDVAGIPAGSACRISPARLNGSSAGSRTELLLRPTRSPYRVSNPQNRTATVAAVVVVVVADNPWM